MNLDDIKTSDFDYDLPHELIAQTPLPNRKNSRMMVVHMDSQTLEHRHFYDITDYFHEGDVLVRNNTRVLPARLYGTKEQTGAHVEVLLLRQMENDIWECLVGNAHVVKVGTIISFHDGRLKAQCTEIGDKGIRKFKMIYSGIFNEILEQLGEVPLPPYIHEKLNDPERYQTVYSKVVGSAAAPTAGLHFTEELLDQIRGMGVKVCFVTLHVGLGTFRPVKEDEIETHEMHSEFCIMPKETADAINETKANGGRVIAIGTTSCRTIESFANEDGTMDEKSGWTDIFIYPGYRFKCVDELVTNFHLPESTLIMLVSALAGRENVLRAYDIAVQEKYRFFSFGDAMFIGSPKETTE